MSDGKPNGIGRRPALKTLGLGLCGLGLASRPVTADSAASEGSTDDGPITRATRIDETDDGMSDKEHREFMNEMADKYGDRKALGLVPRNTRSDRAIVPASLQSDDVEIAGKNPVTDPGEIKWSDRDTLQKKSPGGGIVVEADCYAARYKTGVYNEEGDEYYMYWMWMSARSQDHFHYTGNIENFWSQIDLGIADLESYDPGGDKSKNGMTVDVGAQVSGETPGGAGASAGISGSFVLNEDTVRPHRQKTGFDIDSFAVEWIGDYEGTQEINGACVVSTTGGIDATWRRSLDGGYIGLP